MAYYISSRAKILWFVTLVSIMLSVFTFYMIFNMPMTILSEFDSLISMRIWQGLLLILGNIFTATMIWMSNRYVLSIHLVNMQNIAIKTWSIFKLSNTRIFQLDDFKNNQVTSHDGELFLPRVPLVMAPWDSLKLNGGKKFIVDTQGSFPLGYEQYWELVHGFPFQSK